jgi:phosphoribosylanthranilate isomerase
MVKVKLCGMTNLDDCLAAVDMGVDFIGFVFYRKSKRYIDPGKVRRITDMLKDDIKTVGVFVEETDREIREMLDVCRLDFAQVYRSSSIANRISVSRVGDRVPVVETGGMVLFDSLTDGFGGSGVSFDFGLLEGNGALGRAFVAGGVNEKNLSRVLALGPYGIDLVSSVEERAGKKDRVKMKNLMNKVRSSEL